MTVRFFKFMDLILSLMILSHCRSQAQSNADRFFNIIENKQLEFDVGRVGEVTSDSHKILFPRIVLSVTSLNIDSILRIVNRDSLIIGLIKSLSNPTKDWYANAILYDITKYDQAHLFILINNRNDWVKYQKDKDMMHWKEYLYQMTSKSK